MKAPYAVEQSDDEEDEPILDSEDDYSVNASDEVKNRLRRSGDQKLKDRAMSLPYYLLAKCKCGNFCVGRTAHGTTAELRQSYWGRWDQPAPSSLERSILNWNILSRFYSPHKKDFQFCITNYDRNNVLVCEAAYLILLGYSCLLYTSDAADE